MIARPRRARSWCAPSSAPGGKTSPPPPIHTEKGGRPSPPTSPHTLECRTEISQHVRSSRRGLGDPENGTTATPVAADALAWTLSLSPSPLPLPHPTPTPRSLAPSLAPLLPCSLTPLLPCSLARFLAPSLRLPLSPTAAAKRHCGRPTAPSAPSRARQIWRGWLARAAIRKRPDLPDGLGLLRLSLLRFIASYYDLLRVIVAFAAFDSLWKHRVELLNRRLVRGLTRSLLRLIASIADYSSLLRRLVRGFTRSLLRLIAAYCGLLRLIAVIGSRLHALPGAEAPPAVADDERRPDGAALLADGRLDSWDRGVA